MPGDWTQAEKKLARRVFDAALQRDLAEVMEEFKSMAAKAVKWDDMWSTGRFLTHRRAAIDSKYDDRYSRLEFVFGRLLSEGRISVDDISGLSEVKVQGIIHMGALLDRED